MPIRQLLSLLLCAFLVGVTDVRAQGLNPAVQTRLDRIRDEAVLWAADPVVVGAVLAQNREIQPELASLTQVAWEGISDKSPFLQKFIGHPAAVLIHAQAGNRISEAFLSDAQGRKVAFLGKPTNWTHQGKPKHEVPMSGKTWQGKIEVDRSAGTKQIQVAVPVLSDGVPVGSLVIGVPVSTLAGE